MIDDPKPDINKEINQKDESVLEKKKSEEDKMADIQIGLEYEKMTHTTGWKLLKTFLEKQYNPEVFLNCEDQEGFFKLRERGKAFQAVIKYVDQAIRKAQRLMEETKGA
jgi:hypothetical protein